MVNLSTILNRLNPVKILVIGDMLLDTYTIGKVRRISPEAPVAVVHVQEEDHRPGGAGNVILNLLSLGAQVSAIGRVGGDWAGRMLCEALEREGVSACSIVEQEGYITPVKNRIIADNQQIVRVDREQVMPLSKSLEDQLIAKLERFIGRGQFGGDFRLWKRIFDPWPFKRSHQPFKREGHHRHHRS